MLCVLIILLYNAMLIFLYDMVQRLAEPLCLHYDICFTFLPLFIYLFLSFCMFNKFGLCDLTDDHNDIWRQ